ncbi:unnamed protein product [Musa acuminata subsp. burmannicoides]
MPAADFQGLSAPFASTGRSFLSLRRDHAAHPMDAHHRHHIDAGEQREFDAFQRQVADLFNDLAGGGDEILSISWIRRLLDTFLMCQEEFRVILFGHRRPPTLIDRLVSDFFERAVKALDVCNAVRDGVDQVRQWRKHLEIVLVTLGPGHRELSEGQLRRAKKALGDLAILMLDEKDTGSVMSHRNRSFGRNSGSSSSSSGRRSHFRSLSWSVSRSWSAARQLQAIGSNIAAPRGHEVVETAGLAIHFSVPRSYLWSGPIMSLHERIVEESKKKDRKNSIGLLKEIHQIEKCVHHLTDLMDAAQFPMADDKAMEVRQGLQELAQVYEAMKEGLDPLERQVREVFLRIVRSRTEGLNCLNASNAEEPEATLLTISEDIDRFLRLLLAVEDGQDGSHEPPEIPESTVEKFVILVEEEIAKYETGEEKWPSCDDELSLLDAIDRVSKLTSAVAKFSSELKYNEAMNHSGSVLHHAMCFLEDEFHSLLQDSRTKQEAASSSSRPKQLPSLIYRFHEPERSVSPSSESSPCESSQAYIPENTERLHRIADAMISAGYVTECCQVFSIARRNAFEAGLPSLGFEKVGIEDVIKMAWENLESEIATWVKAFRHTITASFTAERELCEAVFASHRAISDRLFLGFANGAIVQLLTFAEAVTMTKRSAEKLFKVLDVYEAMRDVLPTVEALLPEDGEKDEPSVFADPKTEISSLRYRLGEAAVAIFCDLESSIKADNSKTPVPGGAVHPLTRYVMNYLKYACEYKSTLEQTGGGGDGDRNSNSSGNDNYNPFAAQLIEVMDLLHSNLESKSKLYKDLALSNIFLMNNGRYIAKKVKGSPEIHQLLGETWYRKRSSDLRQYHKNYQRETWSKLLACLRDDGLQVRGSVAKPVLKERFKSFNAMFDEIHKAQSSWVVSDEQLQSELRVSVSAVVVPAYRSFLGRFSQYLDPGRQTEKYIKFGPEDLENLIDELFDGTPSSSIASRRRT